MSLFEPVEIFAPNAQKADPGAPEAVSENGPVPEVAADRSTASAGSLAAPASPRASLFGWVGLLGFATYCGGLPAILDLWLR